MTKRHGQFWFLQCGPLILILMCLFAKQTDYSPPWLWWMFWPLLVLYALNLLILPPASS